MKTLCPQKFPQTRHDVSIATHRLYQRRGLYFKRGYNKSFERRSCPLVILYSIYRSAKFYYDSVKFICSQFFFADILHRHNGHIYFITFKDIKTLLKQGEDPRNRKQHDKPIMNMVYGTTHCRTYNFSPTEGQHAPCTNYRAHALDLPILFTYTDGSF